MEPSLDKQFAAFIRKKRGEITYQEFARKVGLTKSSLHRIEQGEQSITLRNLEVVLKRLKCKVKDVFKEGN